MSRSRIGGVMLIIGLVLGTWFGLPPLERALAPQVTVAELHAHPERFIYQVVQVRGIVQWVGTNICRIPGPAFMVIADAPAQIMITENQPLPPNAIRIPVKAWERFSLGEQPNQAVIVWGRIQQEEGNVITCPGDPSPSPSTEQSTSFAIDRIQFPDGRVLP